MPLLQWPHQKVMSSRNESPCFAASGGKIPLKIQLLKAFTMLAIFRGEQMDPVSSSRLLLHLRSRHEVNSTIQHQDDTSVIVHGQVKTSEDATCKCQAHRHMQLMNSNCHYPTPMYSSQSCPPYRLLSAPIPDMKQRSLCECWEVHVAPYLDILLSPCQERMEPSLKGGFDRWQKRQLYSVSVGV